MAGWVTDAVRPTVEIFISNRRGNVWWRKNFAATPGDGDEARQRLCERQHAAVSHWTTLSSRGQPFQTHVIGLRILRNSPLHYRSPLLVQLPRFQREKNQNERNRLPRLHCIQGSGWLIPMLENSTDEVTRLARVCIHRGIYSFNKSKRKGKLRLIEVNKKINLASLLSSLHYFHMLLNKLLILTINRPTNLNRTEMTCSIHRASPSLWPQHIYFVNGEITSFCNCWRCVPGVWQPNDQERSAPRANLIRLYRILFNTLFMGFKLSRWKKVCTGDLQLSQKEDGCEPPRNYFWKILSAKVSPRLSSPQSTTSGKTFSNFKQWNRISGSPAPKKKN